MRKENAPMITLQQVNGIKSCLKFREKLRKTQGFLGGSLFKELQVLQVLLVNIHPRIGKIE